MERLGEYFDPNDIDDSMGGTVPVASMLDSKAYAERMTLLDSKWQVRIEAESKNGVEVGQPALA